MPASSPKGEDKDAGKLDAEAQKVKALLEGKNPAAEQLRLIVQVGAFVEMEKVREVRRKLEQAGLKTYTQVIDGRDGRRTTRVRVGKPPCRARR